VTIQLRYLQTLIEVSNNQSSTIVFPLPMDVLQPLLAAAQGGRSSAADASKRVDLDEALAAAREALDGAASDPAPVESAARPTLAVESSEPFVPGEHDVAGKPPTRAS
jgi:hypothetical protein